MRTTQKSLKDCSHLESLYCSLNRERNITAKQSACGSRFGELAHEEKQLISSMMKELTEYEHYLNALRDATFLNKYITMVQSFCQKKTREIYLDLSEVVGQAFCNTLDDFLFNLNEVALLHERLQGYLNGQSFRSWAIGSKHNKTHKYQSLFRYTFPDCDFDRPLVIRNPNLYYDNATKMFYNLVDIYNKMNDTRVYALSSTDLLWLGKLNERHATKVKSSECATQLWLEVCEDSTESFCPCPTTCTTYNGMWFPSFNMYIQFKCEQRRCDKNIFIKWEDTLNCCDSVRQQALFERCNSNEHVTVELYTRAIVDWELYCPFQIKAQFTQHDGASCSNAQAHIKPFGPTYHVETVREDNLLVLQTPCNVIAAGTYATVQFKTTNISPDQWKRPLEQLLFFYKSVIDTQDMQMLQTESQGKQIINVANCIRKNIAMYQDLIGEYVHVNNVQAVNKIRKLNELIKAVEDMLVDEPIQVIASAPKSKVQYHIRGEAHGKSKSHKPHTHTSSPSYPNPPHKYTQSKHAYKKDDYDSDISDFSDNEGYV